MRRRHVWFVGSLAMVAAGWAASCGGSINTASSGPGGGSSTSSSTTGSSSSGANSSATASSSSGASTSSSAVPLAGPPPPGPVQMPDGTSTASFAMNKIYLGDTDPDGTPDMANGW